MVSDMMTAEQLKGSILQLAIQGKLVEQKPEEGTGEELYRKAIKGKGSNSNLEEYPIDIPETWYWVQLDEVCNIYTGNSISENVKKNKYMKDIEGYPYIATKDVQFDNTVEYDNGVIIPFKEDFRHAYKGAVLMCIEGGSAGRKIALINRDVCFGNKLCMFYSLTVSNQYIYHYLQSPLFQGAFRNGITGIIGGVSIKKIKSMWLPLPPLAEQKRIVAKIEELMPFVEQYAAASTKLNTLNASFPEMMKKSILQEAVQGKLVPQNPNDEPAGLLLKKIAEEKKRLIREGKIKKGKYDYYIEHRKEGSFCVTHKGMTLIDEMIFDLPDNWTFCTLSELVQFIGGYAYKSNLFVKDSPYQVLRLGNVKNDLLKLDVNPVYITENLAKETQEFLVRHNDILLTMTGTRLKRDYFYTVCVDDSDNSLFVNQRVGCLRPYFGEMSKWLSYVLKSNYVLNFIFNYETGTANQGNLGAENIMKIIIPLPPINEQKRIVKMLDELTAINKDLLIGPLCE